jgi:peptidoglycan/LPS O-acetylase OafA/YrhL
VTTASPAAPRPVRIAGLLVVLQGLAGLAFAGVLLVAALTEPSGPVGPRVRAATVVTLALFGALVMAEGALLARGRRGARTPAIVTQLLLLGVCWYAAVPSSQPAYGLPAAAYCVAVLVLLFCPPALRWATDIPPGAR